MAGESSAAIFGLVGALGGTLITGTIALVSSALSRRWNITDAERNRRLEISDRRYQERREVYANLLLHGDKFSVHCENIRTVAKQGFGEGSPEFSKATEDLMTARHEYEITRAQAIIIASDEVRKALDRYEKSLKLSITVDVPLNDERSYTSAYYGLIEAIRMEFDH
ncbi:hypothetical protein [Actinomadura welshii]|uniref:hypothetical protein n=1 Tax=Actinomadura welshii TaxID=3103817 RepID=UPI0012680017|nr:hypothetical protein [Actinomadura madurae]